MENQDRKGHMIKRRKFIQTTLLGSIAMHMKLTAKENLTTIPIPPSFFDKRKDTIFTWLGMAGVLINSRGTIIFIDPLITYGTNRDMCETGHRLLIPLPILSKDVPKADIVCYTHADGDHFAKRTAEIMNSRLTPTFISPRPVITRLKEINVEKDRLITALDFASHSFGETEIVITPALHDWQEANPWQRQDCCGYIINTPDGSIWHPGDTRLIPELEKVKNIDVLFFDVAAVRAHLGPKGSSRLAKTSGAKLMVAYHYGTFDLPPGTFGSCDPEDSLPFIKNLTADFIRPNPGEFFKLPIDLKKQNQPTKKG